MLRRILGFVVSPSFGQRSPALGRSRGLAAVVIVAMAALVAILIAVPISDLRRPYLVIIVYPLDGQSNIRVQHWTRGLAASLEREHYRVETCGYAISGPAARAAAIVKLKRRISIVSSGGRDSVVLVGWSTGAWLAYRAADEGAPVDGIVGIAGLYDLAGSRHPWVRRGLGDIPDNRYSIGHKQPSPHLPRIVMIQARDDRFVPLAQAQSACDSLRLYGHSAQLIILPTDRHGPMDPESLVMFRSALIEAL